MKTRRQARYPRRGGDFGKGVKRGAGGCLGIILVGLCILGALLLLAAM